MVYSSAESICNILDSVLKNKERCVSTLKNFEVITESVLNCMKDEVAKAVKQKDIVAIVYTQEGCDVCEEQLGAMLTEMDMNPDFAAVEINTSIDECGKIADAEKVEVTPMTVYYRKGQKIRTVKGNRNVEEIEKELRELSAGS